MLLPSRLNSRIILVVSCILLATGITYGWMTARSQTASLLASMRINSAVIVAYFAENCARYLLVQDYAELESFLLKSAEISNIRRLQLCEPNGTLIWEVSRDDSGQFQAKARIDRISPPVDRTAMIASDTDLLVLWQPVMAGNMLGWLKAEFSLSAIKEAQAATWRHTLFMTTAWVACSALLVVLMLRPIIRSIARLTAFSKQLDANKGAQISVTGQPLEIAELGESLNEASARLLATERQILNDRERLQKSEENYRQLLDTIQEGIWVIDADAVTTFVNPRMAGILGYASDEMIGRHLFTFMDEQGKQIAEDNIERRKRGITEQHDFEFIRKNGERIYTRLETGPIVDEAGNYAGSIAAVSDITERKNAELRLYASEQLFRTLAENSPDVIVRYDREGRRIYVNPEFERVNRLTAEQVLGRKPLEISTELAPMAEVFTEKLMAAMESGTVTKVDLSWTKEGKLSCWFVRVVPEFDAEGSVASALTIWSDISERKQTEDKIQKLNEELEQRVRERTSELEEKNSELARLNRIFVGRELRMIELKERIRELENNSKTGDQNARQ
jgi:PAS domain S-box-containing protein